jgi:SAM-dependent methyltransferase
METDDAGDGGATAMSDGLRRSWRLFSAFRVEQTDPHRFYDLLARDSAELIARHHELSGATLLDVGAGPAEFADTFRERGAHYVAVDYDETVASVASGGLVGDAHRLPVRTGSVDVTFSSNLVEHVQEPWTVADEMVRVTRPGGVMFLSYTNWLSPWGGHETSPFHWISGPYAVRRYTRKHGHPPKNRIGENLFAVSVAWGLRWAAAHPDVQVVELRPRYLPRWTRLVLRIPALRELVTWNLLIILRRR